MSESDAPTSVSYPFLNDVPAPAPAISVVASAPVDTQLFAQQQIHNKHCAVCKVPNVDMRGSAFVMLSCLHKVHLTCLFKIPNVEKSENKLGGAKVCMHCLELTLSRGHSSDSTDPEIEPEACLKKLKEMHVQAGGFAVDTEAILKAGTTDEILSTILGIEKSSRKLAWPSAKSLVSVLKSPFGSKEQSEEAVEETPMSLPSGQELVEQLRASHRTLDDVLNTLQINLAHLYVSGIMDLDQLKAIGFDVRRHLKNDFRPVLPVYMLVEHYGLSYDEHLRGVVSPNEIAAMKLTKRELRLLGVTVSKLMETKRCTKQTLLDFHLPPASMIKFMGMEYVHLQLLGFTSADFDKEEHWKGDKHKNEQVKTIVKQLDAKKK